MWVSHSVDFAIFSVCMNVEEMVSIPEAIFCKGMHGRYFLFCKMAPDRRDRFH